jgi:2,3-bisphosphoglycerate-dependent phosphoglycerate mutase
MLDFRSRARLLVLVLVALIGCATNRSSQPESTPVTTVFIVRHAEKDLTPGQADPGLTPEGLQRAEALRDTLGRYPVAALYTTDTARTRATIAPLATRLALEPQVYDSRQPDLLARRLREQHRGQTVVVVGHSNTVLPLIDALGAPRPVPELSDADYDYLFEVTLPSEGAATARASHYGAPAPKPQ